MSANLKPTTAQAVPWTPPTICRRCDDVIDANTHTLDDCEASQVHQANNEAFAKSMQREIAGVA